jgi:hypothetical protein
MSRNSAVEELEFASISDGADAMDHYGVVSSEVYDAYERQLLNLDTLRYEVDTHFPRLLDTTIDLSFIEADGVFL